MLFTMDLNNGTVAKSENIGSINGKFDIVISPNGNLIYLGTYPDTLYTGDAILNLVELISNICETMGP